MNEVVPLQAPQYPQVPIEEGDMSNVDIRAEIHILTQVLTTVVARDTKVEVNLNTSTTALSIRDITTMIPILSMVLRRRRTHKGSVMKTSKFFDAMGVSSQEKAELDAYQLKDVAQVWFKKWKDERSAREDQINWGSLKKVIHDRFFPLELREREMQEFINLSQGGISVKE